ncbi:hypothetical protein [Halobellus salinisoli]|uniref:hypothetical protein n=1 Tax=Halobellus salinisoli TaxID=3108500 RepID=UPI00300A7703
MPSDKQYNDAVNTVCDDLEKVDCYVLDVVEPDNFEGHIVYFRHGSRQIEIFAEKEERFFDIGYRINLAENIGQSIDFEPNEEQPDLFGKKVSPETAVGYHKLAEIPTDQMRDFTYQLGMHLSSPFTSYQLSTDNDGVVYSYAVWKKLFPYERDYTLRRLEEAIQAVVSVGVNANRFVNRVLQSDFLEGESTHIEDNKSVKEEDTID